MTVNSHIFLLQQKISIRKPGRVRNLLRTLKITSFNLMQKIGAHGAPYCTAIPRLRAVSF